MHVVITGANRGIGQALGAHHRALGHQVTGTSRSGGADLLLDVTDAASQRAMATSLRGVPIDLLICNAGVYVDKGHDIADGYPAEMWAETFAANVTGVFLTVQSLLENLKLADQPKIAIISSQMASDTNAPGGSYIYRSSKAAALNLGRNMAVDFKPLGIAVGIYHPGWVQTDMGTSAAEITVTESATGLGDRFTALSIETTGCFETWDGRAHPF